MLHPTRIAGKESRASWGGGGGGGGGGGAGAHSFLSDWASNAKDL